MKEKFTRQQWMVLIGACLFQCALIGVLINSSGVLLAQIRTEYGFPLTRVSGFNTVKSVVCALGGVTLTSLFFKSKKWMFMSCNILLIIISYCMLILDAKNPVVWYASAALGGINSCTVSVMIPFLLNQWFPGNAGTVTGLAVAFSGLGGMIFNPITAKLIGRLGWRWTIVILSGITALLGIAAIVLLFCHASSQKTESEKRTAFEKPLGKEEEKIPAKKVFLCVLALSAGCFVMQFSQYVTIFAQSVGYTLQVGATLTSIAMIGNVGGKLLFGYICDKIGVYKAMVFAMAAIGIGSVLYAFFNQFLPVLYVASALYGMVYGLVMISVSRCCIQTYGVNGSKKYMGLHTSVNGVFQTLSSMSVGILYEATGGFETELLGGMALLMVSSSAALILDNFQRKKAETKPSMDSCAEINAASVSTR